MEEDNKLKSRDRLKSCCKKLSYFISQTLERIFYKLGCRVAAAPWTTITICWIVVAVCSLGFFKFYKEKHPLKLWVPQDSLFVRDTLWLLEKFGTGFREQNVLITADNVLSPNVLRQMAQIQEKVVNITSENNNGVTLLWRDVCFKVPIIAPLKPYGKVKREITNSSKPNTLDNNSVENTESEEYPLIDEPKTFDPSVAINANLYCFVLNNLLKGCLQYNLLDIWSYNANELATVSTEDIINKINTVKISPTLGHPMNYVDQLGGVEYNSTGHIISATSVLMQWMLHINFSAVDLDKTGNNAGTEDWATPTTQIWEKRFIDIMNNVSRNSNEIQIFYEAKRSYGDISSATMFQDIDKLILGIILMFIYIHIILSKCNWVEQRSALGNLGLMCVGMAFLVAIGVCSVLGVSYGPVHTSLPFLLMGLGIDDMFVMMACWNRVIESHKELSLKEQIGLMLSHAGSSITVTSFTDIAAFLVGASTILPSLQSFCIYAAVGVFMIFVFSITFFVACFTLDQRREKQNRNGFVPCYKHKNYLKNECSQKRYSHKLIRLFYNKIVLTTLGKTFIIISSFVMLGFSIESALKIEQKFDPIWFIPERTYLYKYIQQREKFFPNMGHEASIFLGKLNYSAELPKIISISRKLENQTDIIHEIQTWTTGFSKYMKMHFHKDVTTEILSDDEWRLYISKYLFSPSGAKYSYLFRFSPELKCGQPAGILNVASISFRFKVFSHSSEAVSAMRRIRKIIDDTPFETGDKFSTVWAKIFANWITDEVIEVEVMRNLGLALVCVMGCTIVLIADYQMCFWIFLCVLITLVNVCGWMQRWGLTIDLVSCIGLELAVGLCVDYAAHVGHTFLTITRGNRHGRALDTVSHIGAAVFYGGGSTLLALSMLAFSEAYTFQAFFKIFLLVIIFGLFNGVILLPVILSIIGPLPYQLNVVSDIELQQKHEYEPVTIKEQKSVENNCL